MSRIRTIKPEFPEDEILGRCSRDARLLFLLLFTLADDHGRFRASGAYLKGRLYPYDEDLPAATVGAWLDELKENDRVATWEIGSQLYGALSNWSRHQRVDNAGHTRIPDPPQQTAGQVTVPQSSAGLGDPPLYLGPRTEDLGPRTSLVHLKVNDGWFEKFWDMYPRRIGRRHAEKAWAAAAHKRAFPGEILGGLTAQLPGLMAKPVQYRPHPSTWLNRDGWLDEPEAAPESDMDQIARVLGRAA